MSETSETTKDTTGGEDRCDVCEVGAQDRWCEDCGEWARVIDCGHHAQRVKIAKIVYGASGRPLLQPQRFAQRAKIAASVYGAREHVCETCERDRSAAGTATADDVEESADIAARSVRL